MSFLEEIPECVHFLTKIVVRLFLNCVPIGPIKVINLLDFLYSFLCVVFRLLNCGMSLLQGEVMSATLSKHVLRQKIYSCSLDFFCADKQYPVSFYFSRFNVIKYLQTPSL